MKAPKLQLPRRQTLNSSLAYCRALQHLEPANKEPLLTPVCKLQKLLAPISKPRQVQHLLAPNFEERLLLPSCRPLQLLETSIEEHRLWLKRRHFQLLMAQWELRRPKLVIEPSSWQPLQPQQLAAKRLSYRQAAPERALLSSARDQGSFPWSSLQKCSTANTTQLNANKMEGPLSLRRS